MGLHVLDTIQDIWTLKIDLPLKSGLTYQPESCLCERQDSGVQQKTDTVSSVLHRENTKRSEEETRNGKDTKR